MAAEFMNKAAYDIGKYSLLPALPAAAFLLMAPVETITRLAVVAGLLIAPATAIIRLNGAAANALRRYMLTILPDFVGKGVLLLLFVGGWVLVTGSLSLAVVAVAFIVLSYMTAWITRRVLNGQGSTGLGRGAGSVKRGKTWAARATPLIIVAMSLVVMAGFSRPCVHHAAAKGRSCPGGRRNSPVCLGGVFHSGLAAVCAAIS